MARRDLENRSQGCSQIDLVHVAAPAGGDPLKDSSVSFAFNKNFEAAGYANNAAISQHAVFWKNDAAHTIVDLGVFGYDWTSIANGLNDLGQVVGESHPPSSSRAILWQNDAVHTAVELRSLPGDNYGSASLINATGTIVGYSAYGEPGTWNISPSKLVVWIGGAVYDLQSLVVQNGDVWTINNVMSMNNLGQMAAFATRNGVTKPVVLEPAVIHHTKRKFASRSNKPASRPRVSAQASLFNDQSHTRGGLRSVSSRSLAEKVC